MGRQRLIVSSRNEHKLAELRDLLEGLGLEIVSAEAAGVPEVEETGATFEDNALLKAAAAFRTTGCMSLADDSGLTVTALDDAPGVYSARFAGENVTYGDNNRHLLDMLSGQSDRRAAFVCTLCLVVPQGHGCSVEKGSGWVRSYRDDVPPGTAIYVMEGCCRGVITHELRGEGGFGYDPLFFHPETGCTFAEMTSMQKHAVSHRGAALTGLRACLDAVWLNRQTSMAT